MGLREYLFYPPALRRKLDGIDRALQRIEGKEIMAQKTLDDVLADVSAEKTVEDGLVTLVQGIKAQLDAAVAAGDLNKVAQIAASLEANTQTMSDAIVANTPAAPAA